MNPETGTCLQVQKKTSPYNWQQKLSPKYGIIFLEVPADEF